MQQIRDEVQRGCLSEALAVAIEQLKVTPKQLELRSLFIELLCIDGQYERADQQLTLLVKQNPECLPSAATMRQLVKAAQARVDFASGCDSATLVNPDQGSLGPLIELRLALRDEQWSDLELAAEQLERLREPCALDINDQEVTVLRDIDDTLAGYLEVFGANGQYYLVPFSDLSWFKFLPAESLFETIWRKAEIDITAGPSGEVFIPLTYLTSLSDAEKLGRETDWQKLNPTEVYQGRGQKLLMVNDDALAISEIASLSLLKARVNA